MHDIVERIILKILWKWPPYWTNLCSGHATLRQWGKWEQDSFASLLQSCQHAANNDLSLCGGSHRHTNSDRFWVRKSTQKTTAFLHSLTKIAISTNFGLQIFMINSDKLYHIIIELYLEKNCQILRLHNKIMNESVTHRWICIIHQSETIIRIKTMINQL